MKNPLAIWKGNGKAKRQQDIKNRLLKNREAVLDVMSQNIKGARACPYLMGQKCIGGLCEHFMEWQSVNNETGKMVKFHRCAHVQLPLLVVEAVRELSLLRKELASGYYQKDSKE